MRLKYLSRTQRTLVWFTVYSLVISSVAPLTLAHEGGWLFSLSGLPSVIQNQRNGPRPKPGAPDGEFPNLNEIRQRNLPEPQAPTERPSTIRSQRNPLSPWDGKRVGDPLPSISRVAKAGKKSRVSHHSRSRPTSARFVTYPVPDDQYVQNFFSWALLRNPNGSEAIYWNDIYRKAYANGQGSLVLATRELGKTLFESSEYAARNRSNHWYVYDLYKTFLMRDPDSGGWAYWESVVPTSGRENVRRAFEDCLELANLLATVTPNGSISSAVSSLLTARNDPTNQPANGMLARDANWSITLLSLPGRSGLDLGLTLSYSSMVWTRSGSYIYFDEDNGFPSPGFRLGFPTVQRRLFDAQVGKNAYLFITGGARRVELRQLGTSNVYEAADSSYLHLIDNGTSLLVRSTDGTQLSYSEFNNEYRCTQIKDRNGNYLTVNYNGLGQITTITDTLARVVNFNYDGNANLLSISQSWNGQTHNWATFGWSTRTMQSSFSGIGVIGAPNGTVIPVVTQVGLHDGSYFTFDYTNSLQASVIRRYSSDQVQRASTVFNYDGATGDCPRLITTRVSAHNWTGVNGVPAEVITQYGVEGSACVLTAPDGTIYKEFYGTGWQKGLTTLSEVWSGGVRQKWTATTWTQDNTSVNYKLNPRVTETNVYDAAGNRRRTTTEYHPSFGLTSIVTEYAADAATVLRRTTFDYKNDSVYIDRRIIGLLFRQAVYDGSWNLMEKTEYGYDWNSSGDMFQDTPAPATQHDRTNYGPTFIFGRGNLSQVARFDVNDPNNANNTWQETKWRVNSTGSVLMERDHQWHQSLISYGDSFSDGNNNRNTFAYPTTITDAGGFNSYMQYNFDFGAQTRVQGPPPAGQPQGMIQTFTYDNAVRVSQMTTVNIGAYTRHEYGPNYIQSYGTVNNVADEAYSVQMFDGVGRVTAAATNHPGSSGGYSAVHSVYDAMGRLIKRSNPTEVLWDWAPFADDAAGWLYTQQTYDWQGRPRITTNTDGTTKEASYGGCGCAGGTVVTMTDEGTVDGGVAKRRQQKIYSDVLGRTVKTEVLNWQGGSVYSATVNTYNARDQVTLIRQFQGNAPSDPNDLSCPASTCQQTVMTYDGRGRLKTKHVPEQNAGTATTWDYNSDDTIQKITDARGASQTFAYNSRHLVTGITYNAPAGIPIPGAVTFGYDAAANRSSMTDGQGSKSYSYNQLSRLMAETRTFNGVGSFTLSYDYNLAGDLKKVTDPTNMTINYGYDSIRRLISITGSDTLFMSITNYASNFQYRAWGGLKAMTNGANQTSSFLYNSKLQPSHFEINNLVSQNYEYYNDGRIRFVDNLLDATFDRSYSYDRLARLTLATTGGLARGDSGATPYHETFGYDVFDNLTSRYTLSWGQDEMWDSATYANNRRSGWGYDTDGRNTTIGTRTYTFDAAGRTTLMTGQRWVVNHYVNTSQSVTYDGDGRRVKEVINGVTTYYLSSTVLGDSVVAELNGSGQKNVGYVYSPGGVVLARQVPAGTNSYIAWKHGTPVGTGQHDFNVGGAFGSGGAQRVELDPLGASVPLDYTPPPETQGEGDVGASQSGGILDARYANFFDVSGGCMMDWMATSCGMAMGAVNSEAGVVTDPYETPEFWWNQKLANDGLGGWMKFQAKADGYAGYIPVGATYLGGGFWALQRNSNEKNSKKVSQQNPLSAKDATDAIRKQVGDLLKNKQCKKFLDSVLSALKTSTGIAPIKNKFSDVFKDLSKRVGFYDGSGVIESYGLSEINNGRLSIGVNFSKATATGIHSVGITAIHETLHAAASRDLYSQYDAAKAAFDVGRQMDLIPELVSAPKEGASKEADAYNSQLLSSAIFAACGRQ